ncbi:hypothetical protein BC937DRAFT_89079 [Endogone sp. FLAS-F59071]|nr:hypothetical protein BC937DRAFT_89079 [Endogone sp. FLAS-F59071]|eukprot:RUS18164.1 hypothetical protein BC937DRAFT_89079 [Endogone sp. FLAS-F59071]
MRTRSWLDRTVAKHTHVGLRSCDSSDLAHDPNIRVRQGRAALQTGENTQSEVNVRHFGYHPPL